MHTTPATTIQAVVILLLVAAFGALATYILHPFYACFGILVILAVAVIANRLGPNERPNYFEPVAACMLLLLLILLPAPRGTAVLFSASLAILAAQGTWAYLRYADTFDSLASAELPTLARMQRYSAWGLAYGVGLTVLAALVIAAASRSGQPRDPTMPTLRALTAAYLGGGLVAGALCGLLLPIARWPLGVILLGILGATSGYTAVGVAVDGFSAETRYRIQQQPDRSTSKRRVLV